ncbi:MAG: M23 family metallopeptidase [Campylobacterales bacterium]|nr:M23 family metallopeptidase [Campylobacterales bacterium]
MKKKFLLLCLFIISLYGDEVESILQKSIVINQSLQDSLNNELKLIEENRKVLQKMAIDVLTKDLLYSNIYIEKDLISKEEDIFNNVTFEKVGEMYAKEFQKLNDKLALNRQRYRDTQGFLFEQKNKLREYRYKKRQERMSIRNSNLLHQKGEIGKLDEIISMVVNKSKVVNDIDFTSFTLPLATYSSWSSVGGDKSFGKFITTETNALAVNSGRIIFIDQSDSLNNVVMIKHKNEIISLYGYIKKLSKNVKIGAKIDEGSIIGSVEEKLLFKVSLGTNSIATDIFLGE